MKRCWSWHLTRNSSFDAAVGIAEVVVIAVALVDHDDGDLQVTW